MISNSIDYSKLYGIISNTDKFPSNYEAEFIYVIGFPFMVSSSQSNTEFVN